MVTPAGKAELKSARTSQCNHRHDDAADQLTVSDTEWRVFHAHGLEAKSWNGTVVADTLLALPAELSSVMALLEHKSHVPHASSQIDLFGQRQARDKRSCFGISSSPITGPLSPWRRVKGRRGCSPKAIWIGGRIDCIWVGRVWKLPLLDRGWEAPTCTYRTYWGLHLAICELCRQQECRGAKETHCQLCLLG